MARFEVGIFDFNGTLLEDLPVVYESVCEIFRHYGVAEENLPTLEQYRNEITANFTEFYYKYGVPRNITGDEMNNIRAGYFSAHWERVALYPEAVQALEECKKSGLKLVVVSSEDTKVLTKRLEQFEIRSYFDEVRGDARNKDKVLQEAASLFAREPRAAFYVDDTFDGIQSAKNAGLVTFGTVNGYCSKQKVRAAKPDFVISSLLSVPETLKLVPEMRAWKGRGGRKGFAKLVARALEIDRGKVIDAVQDHYTFSESTVDDLANDNWPLDLDKQDGIIQSLIAAFDAGVASRES